MTAVGVDVGGTKIHALAVSGGAAIHDTRAPTPHESDEPPGGALADAVLDVVVTVADRAGVDLAETPIGVGLPGMMSREGELVFAPNLRSANGTRLADRLAERAPGLQVLCENDADCAAVAEQRLGVARGFSDVLMVTLGTGIGGGVISGGQLVRGRSGFAGEIGHMIVDAHGPRCPCGRRGCWERFASGAGVARLAHEAALAGRLPELVARCGSADAVRGEDVTAAAAAGSAEALEVIDEVGWWLALGIANLVGILDSAVVVVGGGLSEVTGLLLPPARRHLHALLEGAGARGDVPVVGAALGERAGAIGAALLAEEFFG